MEGYGDVKLIGVEPEGGAPMRAPRPDEVPQMRMLAYSSSITQGIGSLYPQLNYLNTAAQILGIDILNKAVSGGCFCEPEMVDYLCSLDFDAVYLEPGTNIADRPEAIVEERVGNLIDSFCTRFPEKPIFIMTPIRGLSDVSRSSADYSEHFPKAKRIIEAHAPKNIPTPSFLTGISCWIRIITSQRTSFGIRPLYRWGRTLPPCCPRISAEKRAENSKQSSPTIGGLFLFSVFPL